MGEMMAKITNYNFKDIVEILNKNPSKENWDMFASALKKTKIKYYKIIWANGGKLNRMQDITRSVAKLYDSKYRVKANVPIFLKMGKKVRGATKYLIGLQILNEVEQ